MVTRILLVQGSSEAAAADCQSPEAAIRGEATDNQRIQAMTTGAAVLDDLRRRRPIARIASQSCRRRGVDELYRLASLGSRADPPETRLTSFSVTSLYCRGDPDPAGAPRRGGVGTTDMPRPTG